MTSILFVKLPTKYKRNIYLVMVSTFFLFFSISADAALDPLEEEPEEEPLSDGRLVGVFILFPCLSVDIIYTLF